MKKTGVIEKGVWALVLVSTLTVVGLTVAQAADNQASIARGGMLYDKWYKVIDVEKPKTTHALYPKEGKKAKDSWRCKECHGWDFMGKDGAYAKGSHFTGIKGIQGAAGKPVSEIVALLKDPKHGYADKMAMADLNDLAMFVSKGQVNMDDYIDRATKKVKGDPVNGKQMFETACAKCHGEKGLLPKDMGETLGDNASGNPWEHLNKILNGQPAEKMPALRAFTRQDVLDIAAYAQTLPKER
ncbi:cytochrome c [Sedimenticola sp.]|uniref:cytochrome c n=1 Tax=Sedimenticola sp. TaxID=1940285 RepID=UPI003D0FE556